jgi:serine/threonine-protein kinase
VVPSPAALTHFYAVRADKETADDLSSRLQRSLGDGVSIERELGGGGMARVFLAREHALDRRIVVKALDIDVSVSAGAERFRREIKVVAHLQHPHVVPVFAAGGDDSLLWYTMPYVSGESLRARLTRDGALPLSDAIRITREVLDALSAAHERGIVHRDIKPENILLEGSHAQVADFGVAKALVDAGVGGTALTTVGLALGTPAYMAPEQAMADPSTNHRADLYAVGAVLYEMLVGAPPFSGNAQSVVAAHLTAPVPQLSDRRRDAPPAVATLVTRLLAKSPAERPQSAAEALETLDGVNVSAPTRAPARKRTIPITAGLVAAAAIGTFAWWNVSRPAAPDFAAGTEVIAVMPLGSTGDSVMSRLGRDLVVTLSANIDGIGTVRTVDAMSVLQRAADLPQPVALDAARRLASALGATYFVHGAIVPDAGGVRVDAALHAVAGDQPLARFRAQNAVTALRELTDTLSSDLLRQIWQRGTTPSPMLADAATPSGDALRAFLEGEAAFEAFEPLRALEAYDRATSIDSNFVQAWLRKEHVRTVAVLPPDSMVTRRLEALIDRMPARDRALRQPVPPGTTFEQQLATLEEMAARFPEYHRAQYLAGDLIIHAGPLHGVPIARAVPYLDRLDSLAPRHADNAQHRWMVALALGDTAGLHSSSQRLASLVTGAQSGWTKSLATAPDAYVKTGRLPDAATITAASRLAVTGMRALPLIGEIALLITPPLAGPAQLDTAFTAIAGDIALRGFERQYILGLASLQYSRGDVETALRTFARLERMNAPDDVRTAGIRSAASAAWLGLISPEDAAAAVRNSRQALTGGSRDVLLDVHWSEAVAAIAARDSTGFSAAVRALTDTSTQRQIIARGLRALWRERTTGMVDSLIAHDDYTMQARRTFLSTVALSRLAIGRSLTLAGDPRRAEHYLQWTDSRIPSRRASQIQRTMTGYTAYQRGIAAEAAGDRRAAILHLRQFVELVDLPPPAIEDQIADAKARLARLVARSG